VALDDALAERQPDSGTRVFVLAVQSLEYAEDAVGIVGVDTDALVLDRDDPLVAVPFGRDLHPWRLVAAVVEGVFHQVLEDLPELVVVPRYGWKRADRNCGVGLLYADL